MSYNLDFTKRALEGIEELKKSGNKSVIKKMAVILEELTEHPYTGLGQPEQLKYDLSGLWSRRINREHRIVYIVNEESIVVTVISAKGHYH
jgi:toxin YoeB